MNGMTAEDPAGTSVTLCTSRDRDDLLSDGAIPIIHETSCGKPRTINSLAIGAAGAAGAAGKTIVHQPIARAAAAETASGE